MGKKMNALVTYGPYDYRYESADVPLLEPGDILIKVRGCGICAGDIKTYHGGIGTWGTSEDNRYIDIPVIGGHEFYGEIVEVCGEVQGLGIGDLVVTEQILPCGECEFCRTGKHWMCIDSRVFGFKHDCQGGFAEYAKLPKGSLIHKVPQGFNPEQAVLIEPIACGMHAVERGGIQHRDAVVVAGLGSIGLSMINLAGLKLPKTLIGLDVNEDRLAAAREFGADYVMNPMKCNALEEVMRLTGGRGCDVYIEASGNERSVSQGIDMLVNHGRFVQMGVFPKEVSANWNIIGDKKELQILGSHLSAMTYPSVIKGISRNLIKTEGLISHTYPLKDWKEAFMKLEQAKDVMKIMLVP